MALEKRWQLFQPDLETASRLSSELSIHPIVAQVCLNRGFSSLSLLRRFLHSNDQSLLDQFPSQKVEKILSILSPLLSSKIPILVYGDYDVDGMTSTALMVSVLRKLGAVVHYMIPSRFEHGYGLHIAVIDRLRHLRAGVLITLDCGVSNVYEISEIKKQLQIPVIVLDHHTLPDVLPPFDVMLNPKELPEGHYYAHLCTVGIVYVFLKALCQALNFELDLSSYEDIVALGTVADVAKLDGFNRDVVKRGLLLMQEKACLGIKALFSVAQFSKPFVTVRDLGFVLAPRLNAAGRLSHAGIGVELLLSDTWEQAERIAFSLEKLNQDRRSIDAMIFSESLEMLQSGALLEEDRVIALSSKGWHSGVIGITASKLVEKHCLPSVVMAYEGDVVRGSARSSGTVDIYSVLYSCKECFKTFGGHKQAAGFSLSPETVPEFISKLRSNAKQLISATELRPVLKIDACLDASCFSLEFLSQLDILYPYGEGNAQPVFYHLGLKPVHFKVVGGGQHLKVTFVDPSSGLVLDAIGFGLSSKFELMHEELVSVAFHLEVNVWQGRKQIQLVLLDLKPAFSYIEA